MENKEKGNDLFSVSVLNRTGSTRIELEPRRFAFHNKVLFRWTTCFRKRTRDPDRYKIGIIRR